jgi:hypothetical protein
MTEHYATDNVYFEPGVTIKPNTAKSLNTCTPGYHPVGASVRGKK